MSNEAKTKDFKKFNCRLEIENYEWLEQQAKKNRRSLTAEFNSIVYDLMQKDQKDIQFNP